MDGKAIIAGLVLAATVWGAKLHGTYAQATYYLNDMGPVEYRTYEEILAPLDRALKRRRPISRAKYDSLKALIPRNGVFAARRGGTGEMVMHKISFRAGSKDSTEIGVCDASTHVEGLTRISDSFHHPFYRGKSAMDRDDTIFECPLPFAPPDSFFLHVTTAKGKTLYRKRFYKSKV